MTAPQSTGPQPQGPSGGTEGVAEVVLALVIILALLPVVVVGAAVALVLRQASRRTVLWALAGGVAVAALEALGWPGYRTVTTAYGGPYRALMDAINSHAHVAIGPKLPGTLWVAIPLGVIAGTAWRLRGAQKASKVPTVSHGAPRAGVRQLQSLVVPAPPGDRVVLGRLEGRLLAGRVETHTAVIAPTRSGKTRGLILPALLDWEGPAIATSAKADLLWDQQYQSGAYAWRQTIGPVYVFDPSGSSGWPCVQWSPLGRAEEWQGALRAAAAMVAAERPEGAGPDSGTSRFFAARAQAVLAPALHLVALQGGGMRDVLSLVRGASDLADLAATMAQGLAELRADPEALSAVEALLTGSDTSSGDTLATVANLLAPYDDPKVAKATDDCDIEIEELLAENGTLFVVAGTDTQRLAPLFACLLDEVFEVVARKALQNGPLSPRLLLALDEVANIAPVPHLPQRLATVGGLGVTVVTAWQSLGQMARWGTKAAGEILGNSAAQLWTASDDPETSEHLSRILGKTLVQTQSVSADAQRGWLAPAPQPKTVSTSWTERSVLDPSAMRLMQSPLLVAQGLPPTQIEWRFHDQDKALAAKSGLPKPITEIEDPEIEALPAKIDPVPPQLPPPGPDELLARPEEKEDDDWWMTILQQQKP